MGAVIFTTNEYKELLKNNMELERIKSAITVEDKLIKVNTKKISYALGQKEDMTFVFEL